MILQQMFQQSENQIHPEAILYSLSFIGFALICQLPVLLLF